jgi:hypothetical protein
MLWAVEPLSHQPHLKSKVESRDDSDSVSGEEGQEGAPAHQVLGTMHLGLPPWAKGLPTLAKSPLQAALQVTHSQRGFTLCLRDWTIAALAYNRGSRQLVGLGNRLHREHLRNKKGSKYNYILKYVAREYQNYTKLATVIYEDVNT